MQQRLSFLGNLIPGVALTLAVTFLALVAEKLQVTFLGQAGLGALVFAILIGVVIRSCLSLSPRFRDGIDFCARTLLEVAVLLLGASISLAAIGGAGQLLVGAIVVIVALSLGGSYAIGRLFGLSPRVATLVACGNSICGNSAIAAAAPVIKAKPDEIASSIAFTAVLGVALVLALPFLQPLLGLGASEYGIFAGLTVYAVPQVLAATAPAGLVSVQTGTLVKLVRVLMLGPVLAVLGVLHGRGNGPRARFGQIVPWFIIGFALLMILRSLDLLPAPVLGPMEAASGILTIIAMAALGLSVDIRSIRQSGGRVIAAASFSLLFLGAMALLFLKLVVG